MAALWILLALLAVLALYIFLTAPRRGAREALRDRGCRLYAHRGLHAAGVPENSLPAFEAACRAGYGIELDVQMTADGALVVFHDDDLLRVCGEAGIVQALTLAQLKTRRLAGGEERIPTLDEVLALVDGRAPLLVEIKNSRRIGALTRAVAARLDAYAGPYVLESFTPLALHILRRERPQAPRGQLVAAFSSGGVALPLRLLLSNLLLNCLSRPDFIAFDLKMA